MSTNAPSSVAIRTIISHSNVRHYLLQYSLPLRELLVLRLCSLEFLAKLLESFMSFAWRNDTDLHVPESFRAGRTWHLGSLFENRSPK